jgi:hypothetical protein
VPAGLPSELLTRRPDLREAEDTIVSANAQVGVAVANFFPRIGLTSLYGGESLELKNVVKSTANIWNVVGSVAGPIFTGGQLIEQYRAQVAAWEQAKTQWAQSVISAFSEVSSALVLQQKLAEVRDAQEKTVHAYEGSVRLSLLRYNTGLANYYEVLEAQQLLFPAQIDLTRTQRDQLVVVVQLYRALAAAGGSCPRINGPRGVARSFRRPAGPGGCRDRSLTAGTGESAGAAPSGAAVALSRANCLKWTPGLPGEIEKGCAMRRIVLALFGVALWVAPAAAVQEIDSASRRPRT